MSFLKNHRLGVVFFLLLLILVVMIFLMLRPVYRFLTDDAMDTAE